MQRFSEQELEEMAKPYLTQKITEVFATTDGQVFYDANRAGQHATQRSLTMYAFGESSATGFELSGNEPLATGEAATGNELTGNEPLATGNELPATGEEPTAETEAIGQEPTAETANQPTAETPNEPAAETEAIGQEPTAETLPAKQESPLPEARKPEAELPEAIVKPLKTKK